MSGACPSELLLDRLFVGELTDDAVSAHVATCARCSGRVEERKACAASFPTDVGLDVLVGQAARTVQPNRLRTLLVAGGALAAAAAIVLVVVGRPAPKSEEPTVRTKGGLSLGLIAKHLDGTIETLTSPAQLAPGEAIELEISTTTAGYLGVIGLDSAGVVSTYAPARRMDAGGPQLLDGSIVLDATPGPERIIAVMCATESEIETVAARGRAALTRVGGNPAAVDLLGLPATCSQASFLIEKKLRTE
jgi:hypothetical protein